MFSFLWFFIGLAFVKAVVEPIATNLGKAFLEEYLDDCIWILDETLDHAGLNFDAEKVVRQYLDLQPNRLSEEEVDRIVEAVFQTWDLRVASRKHLDD